MAPRSVLKREWFDAIYRSDVECVSQMLPQMKKTCNQWGETGLMISAKEGNLVMAELLAPHEAGMTNVEGRTALMLAAAANNPEVCKLLVTEEKHIVTLDSRNALMFAAAANAADAAEILICDLGKTRDALGRAPLHYAVLNQAPHVVQLILQYPNDISHDDISLLLDYAKEYGYDMIIQMLTEYDPINRLMEFDQVSLIKLSELQQLMQKFPSSSLRSEATKLLSEAIESITIDLGKKTAMIDGYHNEISMLHERISVLNETINQQQKELDGLYKTVKLGISGIDSSRQNMPTSEVAIRRAQELMVKPLSVDSSKVNHDEKYSDRCSTDLHDYLQYHEGSDAMPGSTEVKSLETYLAHTKSTPSRADTTDEKTCLSDRDQQVLVTDPTVETEDSPSGNFHAHQDTVVRGTEEHEKRALPMPYSPDVDNDEERQYLAYMALMAEIDEEHGVVARPLEQPPPHLTLPRMRESIGTDEVDAIVSTGSLASDLKELPVGVPTGNQDTIVETNKNDTFHVTSSVDEQIESLGPQQPGELTLLESAISKKNTPTSISNDQVATADQYHDQDYLTVLAKPLDDGKTSPRTVSGQSSDNVDSSEMVIRMVSGGDSVRDEDSQLECQTETPAEPPADEALIDPIPEPPADEALIDPIPEPPADEALVEINLPEEDGSN
ncbi:Hypothetical protein GLP15_474 [Giardia lamblia P15]|uniref:Protein 21.1 n=1 Tax=Giardia intestinalis (strain P15) TaxID=658858 RepID=E1F6H4_GIAIA|nr:Hypothetical protein GLP15_474 [Giardia lamblia P15]